MDLRKIMVFIAILKLKVEKFKTLRPSSKKRKLRIQIIKLFFLCKKMLQKLECRSQWVRYIFSEEKRFLQGASDNLLVELERYDREKYINYLRMAPELFNQLLDIVSPSMKSSAKSFVRNPLPAKIRLQIFLRYLASGNSLVSLSYEFRVGVSTVSNVIRQTGDAIYECLAPKVLMLEPNKDDWKQISEEFERKWNMVHCIGAIDGRHMLIQAPQQSGSIYYNYKNSFSIVFLPVCDANCKFIMFDVGAPGRKSDGGIFRSCEIGKRFFAKDMDLPEPSEVGNDGFTIPYYIVGDEGFPLSEFMMRPYSRRGKLSMRQKIFNYRLSRARRVVECAFGMLVQRFRIFRRPILAKVTTVTKIVKAAVCLHNFIIDSQQPNLREKDMEDLREKSICDGLAKSTESNRDPILDKAIEIRNNLAHYYYYEGSVPWQWQKVRNVEY